MGGMVLEGETLRRDVFPAEVALPDDTVLTDVRVLVTSHRILAFEAKPAIQLVLCKMLTADDVPASRNTLQEGRLECKLEGGGTAWVNRGRGCGCGSPLKIMPSPIPWHLRAVA